MSKLTEARSGGIGVPQQTGYGKNWHTQHPDTITWENVTDLDYFVSALPNGKYIAGISLKGSNEASPTYEFNSEDDAMMWIRKAVEKYQVAQFNQV